MSASFPHAFMSRHVIHCRPFLSPAPRFSPACCRFRQGFLQFFRFCPCQPCRKALRMSHQDRGFYSTRMRMTNTEKMDRNGSLMHTTMESIEDTNSTPTASMYRMHPINHNRPRDRDSFDD